MRRFFGEGSLNGPSTPRQITVDLDGLHDFTSSLRLETNEGLRSGLATCDNQVQRGVRFCRNSPSGEVNAAAQAMAAVLSRHKENATRQLNLSEGLIIAMEQILTNYRDADSLNKAKLSEIETTLTDAVKKLELAQAPKHQRVGGVQEQ